MLEKLQNLVNKKWFHVIVMVIVLVILLFVLGITVLIYDVEGEKNMPFKLTKISVISTCEGIDKKSENSKWAFDINQNNDIFLYIEKNENNGKEQAIKSIVLENFNVNKQNKTGEIKTYKPDATSENQIFTNKEENIVEKIEYIGDVKSNFRDLKISNQGDKIAFRLSNKNISSYESNDEEVINHAELLKKASLTNEDIKCNLSFDITIKVEAGQEYKANVNLELPVGNVIEEGTGRLEITDLDNIIFKRN